MVPVRGKILASIYVGTESGPLQIAIAAGIPTVGIMGGGQAFRFYPYGDLEKHRVVYKQMDCYDCNWHCIYKEALCMTEILPEAMIREIESIMHPGSD